MMDRILFSITPVLLFLSFGFGQIYQPASWDLKTLQGQVELNNDTCLIFNADLDETWQLYSNNQDYDIGPLPATFEFEPNEGYELVGDMEPVGYKTKHEDVFDVDVNYFEGTAEFRQKVKILKPDPIIRGTVNYQVCNMVDGKCINLEEDFEFRIKTIE